MITLLEMTGCYGCCCHVLLQRDFLFIISAPDLMYNFWLGIILGLLLCNFLPLFSVSAKQYGYPIVSQSRLNALSSVYLCQTNMLAASPVIALFISFLASVTFGHPIFCASTYRQHPFVLLLHANLLISGFLLHYLLLMTKLIMDCMISWQGMHSAFYECRCRTFNQQASDVGYPYIIIYANN